MNIPEAIKYVPVIARPACIQMHTQMHHTLTHAYTNLVGERERKKKEGNKVMRGGRRGRRQIDILERGRIEVKDSDVRR